MQQTIASETLRTGETLEIAWVLAPDTDMAPRILPFLCHKPGHYRAHIEGAFAGTCDGLETRFYIGLIDGEVVGNIMTVEANGAGIVGHVHTREDHRRKGICHAIMDRQMQDFRGRGGQVLLLGTGYQSPPYRIYHHFGFRDLPGGDPGTMRYLREDTPDFLARFFAPAPSPVVAAGWRHWPLVALLAASPSDVFLRSLTFGAWGVTLLEGPYCKFMHEWGGRSHGGATVLESETGAVVGIATIVPDRRWPDVSLLDVFADAQVAPDHLTELVSALPVFPGKTVCFADPRDGQKAAALEGSGFQREAVLPRQFREREVWSDVWLYARHAGSERFTQD